MYMGRVTAQATAKNRFSFNHEYQMRCEGSPLQGRDRDGCHTRGSDWIAAGAATTSPEARHALLRLPVLRDTGDVDAPMTSKLLLEAGYTRFSYYHAGGPGQLPPDGIFDIGVTEQSTAANAADGYTSPVPRANYNYRALSNYSDNYGNPNNWRASASYVTGAHNMKVGYQGSFLRNNTLTKVQRRAARRTRSTRGSRSASRCACPNGSTADRTSTVGDLRAGHLDARPHDAAGRAALRPRVEL